MSPAITKPSHPRLSLAENIRILSRMTSRAVYYKVTTMKRNHLILLKLRCVTRPVKNGAVKFTANYDLGPPCKAKCKTVAMRNGWQLSDTMPRDTVQHLKDRYMNAKKKRRKRKADKEAKRQSWYMRRIPPSAVAPHPCARSSSDTQL